MVAGLGFTSDPYLLDLDGGTDEDIEELVRSVSRDSEQNSWLVTLSLEGGTDGRPCGGYAARALGTLSRLKQLASATFFGRLFIVVATSCTNDLIMGLASSSLSSRAIVCSCGHYQPSAFWIDFEPFESWLVKFEVGQFVSRAVLPDWTSTRWEEDYSSTQLCGWIFPDLCNVLVLPRIGRGLASAIMVVIPETAATSQA